MKEIRRDIYLNQLIEKQWNGQVKIIIGLRRSGKSYLLFRLFVNYLTEHDVPQGVSERHYRAIPFAG